MSAKSQHKNIMLAVLGFSAVVVIVAVIGLIALDRDPDIIQGQVEVSEYRVSSKVPGRILELRVKEGDYVKAGDTLAILDAPEVRAKMEQAQSAENAAAALELKAQNGSYKAMEAQMKAAQSQYDMAVNGARMEDKMAATAQVGRAKGAVQEVNSYIHETVQIAQKEGEVTDVYPKVGELVGTGSPIMSIAMMDDMWGTFNVREDQLNGMQVGTEFSVFVPAFNKEVKMKVYHLKDQGSFAVWKATKANGQYDLKTFEVKARPVEKLEGLRPGMSLVIKK